MSGPVQDFEAVSTYVLDPDDREALLRTQVECSFAWSTRDGWPVAVIMSYLWHDGRFWLTAGAHRHRVSAVRRDPRVSVVVTSTGTGPGPGRSITVKGRCHVHEDRETKAWFYPAFARQLFPDPERAKAFQAQLDSPLRVVLEVVPERWITYDGRKMFLDAAGRLPESQRGPRLESDTVRLERELRRRGLKQGS